MFYFVMIIRRQPTSTLFPDTTLFRSHTACLIMEGAEFTENIINGVELPVKAADLFAFTLRVRAGNTDVLTDAEEHVRQNLRAEGVMQCRKVQTILALARVDRRPRALLTPWAGRPAPLPPERGAPGPHRHGWTRPGSRATAQHPSGGPWCPTCTS